MPFGMNGFHTSRTTTAFCSSPYRARTKGKVESGIKYVRKNFWPRVREFTDLDDLNRQAMEWLNTVANVRIHGTTHEIPFERLKHESLKPLNPTPFFEVDRQSRKVSLLVIDEIGYRKMDETAAHYFFQIISERYESGSVILTSNKSYGAWGEIFGDSVLATAILDRLLHHSTTINIKGESYRIKEKKKVGFFKLETSEMAKTIS